MNYEGDIEIDEQALDGEWLDHPRRVVVYCIHAAEMHRNMDLAKERVDVCRAQLDQRIRANPDEFGLGTRITEGSIQSAILVDDEYQETTRAYFQAKYEYDVAQGVVRAFDHRKSALENLVRLHGQSYFAGPTIPHDLGEVRAQRDASVQRRIGMRRRT